MGLDTFLFFGRSADEGEETNAFAVQTHIFCETLAEGNGVTLLDEMPDGEGVLVSQARCKALVCHVKENEVALLFANVADFGPLLGGWVDAGGVVGTGVEQNDGFPREVLKGCQFLVIL